MAEEKSPDWEKIEFEYRAGILSLREIALKHPETNHVAIARRAKKEGWDRDLSARIHAKAEALVTKRAVTEDETKSRSVTERETVESNALTIANVRLSHRVDISRARNLAMALLEELEAETNNIGLFQELGELLRKENDRGIDKLNDAYQKVISSAGRISSMKNLSDALKTLIGLEREAYGLASAPPPEAPRPASADAMEAARTYQRFMDA